MPRLINPRVLLFCAIGLVLGILCGYSIMLGRWLLPILLVVALAVTFAILLLLKNKLRLVVLFVFIFTILGCGLFQIKLHHHQKQEVIARPVVLTGRVTDIGRVGKASNVIYLENCTYDNTKIGGRVQVIVFDGSAFQTGDILTLKGTLRSTYIFASNFNTSYLRNNCNYQLTDTSVISIRGGTLTLDETIRQYIYQSCVDNMTNYPGLMYALITGDDNALEPGLNAMYTNSGMVHLIAVSGMHLVYIITIIGFFINKLKLNPIAEFAVIIGPLVFFCYICDWAPSILRALLMTVCTYLVRWLSGRYDMLIAVSFSVLVLLFVNPYYLFDIGWQLSVMSVLGMATLYLCIDRFLQSKKIGKFWYGLLSSFAISLCCTLATFATIAHYFGKIPVLGVFANLVGVPLMSWAFTIGLVGMLPWVFHLVLHVADGILWVVTLVAKVVSSLDFAVVSLSTVALAIGVTIVWLFVAGQYVNLNKVAKVVVNITLCVVLVVCFVIAGIPSDCTDQVFVNQNFDGANIVVTSNQGDVVVLSNCQSPYSLDVVISHIAQYKHRSITWVFFDMSQFDVMNIKPEDFAKLGIDKVYNLSHTGNDLLTKALTEQNVPVIEVANNQKFGFDITVQSVYDGALTGALVRVGDISFAVVLGGEAQTNHFVDLIPSVNFYVVQTPSQRYLHNNFVTFSLYQDYCVTNYGANKYGNFTITQKDGKIIVNF
ncbi:MAG: ComEC/Rec2 family competence protein [Clostridia bacterium]|nr:ComEC/Rec2 family competence protein [Clostridia bacterium]